MLYASLNTNISGSCCYDNNDASADTNMERPRHRRQQHIIQYYCRHCGGTEEIAGEGGAGAGGGGGGVVVVVDTEIRRQEKLFHHLVNKYTKYDPTLPTMKNVPCPNPECASNTGGGGAEARASNEVFYIRYDDDNLKNLYLCSTCETHWKSN